MMRGTRPAHIDLDHHRKVLPCRPRDNVHGVPLAAGRVARVRTDTHRDGDAAKGLCALAGPTIPFARLAPGRDLP